MPLSYYNFLLTAIIGLDLAVPQEQWPTDYARLRQRVPSYARANPRASPALDPGGSASTDLSYARRAGDLAAALDRDTSALDQLLRLRCWRGTTPARWCRPWCGSTRNTRADWTLNPPASYGRCGARVCAEIVRRISDGNLPKFSGLVLSISVANTNRIAQPIGQ